jgi:DNA helicase-2/ATP-dependent DNA helicase PcrA
MVMQGLSINSDYKISNIEQHFRVAAGPGAGKTYWLIEHIKNILGSSTRLGKTRNIACLTYSNVGVDTIKKRLGTSVQQVEVSTLHSFLYRHIVKPYAWCVADKYSLNIKLIDGHDDIGHYKLQDWIKSDFRSLKYVSDNRDFAKSCLNKQQWIFVGNELRRQISLKEDRNKPYEKFLKNSKYEKYLNYKKLYWQEGTLSHDDVLFFSYEIIKQNSFVLEISRAKFPYFLIDEFQDTSPIQVEILKLLAEKETIVGIIGDKAQSIYGFQGADAAQFVDFSLPNLQNYVMKDNRRSTNQIIGLLNHVRTDIPQNNYRNENGLKPILYVGEWEKALDAISAIIGAETLHVLAFKNEMVKVIEIRSTGKSEDFFKKLKKEDANKRIKWIIASIRAMVFAKKNRFKDAIQEFVRLQRRAELKQRKKDDNQSPIDGDLKLQWKKNALGYISILLSKNDEISKMTITTFSNTVLNKDIHQVSKITKEKSAHKKTVLEFANCVKIQDEVGDFRTIHKAKGDEFDNVLLVLENEKGLKFIKQPDLEKEEHRVRYVAISRARERLFISVPKCNSFSNDLLTKIVF